MARMDLLSEHAREKSGYGETWHAYSFECLPHNGSGLFKYFAIRGAKTPLVTKGKRAGRPNWRQKDRSTDELIIITPEEHEHWLSRWRQATGKCSECVGEGRTVASFGGSGTTYRTCRICGGSGLALIAPQPGARDGEG